MAGQRFGGKFSPGSSQKGAYLPPSDPFRNRAATKVSVRARLMYFLPLPLLFAGLGAIGRGDAPQMLAEIGGFAGLMLSAWFLNEGLRAEAAFDVRAIARPPAIPRKMFGAILTGASVFAVNVVGLQQSLATATAFGLVAAVAQIGAFGLDPMKKKGVAGADDFATERVAKAIDEAETIVREIIAAAARIGDRRLENRIVRLCDQAREVFRVIEADPRDLTRARTFLNVYLRGLRDATAKFADLQGRVSDPQAQEQYEALIGDLETSFSGHRASLLEDNRSDLEVEIEVLRDRLQQDGFVAR